jgi:ribosome maturation factor RimP
MDRLLDKIKQAAEPYINNMGYEMVDLSLSRTKNGWILRFLVDKPSGGISIQECAVLNEGLGGFLDKESILEEGYSLEVSSPGVDRPLVTKKDFLRIYGRWIRVFLNEPIKGKVEMEGILEAVKGDFLYLNSGKEKLEVSLGKVKKAKQVIR